MIKDLNKTLNDIAKEKEMFGFSLRESTEKLERKTTTCVIELSRVHGRVQDKNDIVDLLSDESTQSWSDAPPYHFHRRYGRPWEDYSCSLSL